MKSKQINFFILPQDVAEIYEYAANNELLIASAKSANNPFTLYTTHDTNNRHCCIFHSSDITNIKAKKLPDSQLFYIDEQDAPVIQLWISLFDEQANQLKRGRLYYTLEYLDSDNKLVPKSDVFLQTADKLFKWFRKHFKNQKLPNRQGFHITPRAAQKVEQGIELVEF